MPTNQRIGANESERLFVARTLEAYLREAEHQADLVAAFLRASGIRGGRRTAKSQAPLIPRAGSPVSDFLLGLGAALRLGEWERAGIRGGIDSNLPSAAEALSTLGEMLIEAQRLGRLCTIVDIRDQARVAHRRVVGIARAVSEFGHRALMESGRGLLGTDVTFAAVSDAGDLLDQLADFLWRHRNDRPSSNAVNEDQQVNHHGT